MYVPFMPMHIQRWVPERICYWHLHCFGKRKKDGSVIVLLNFTLLWAFFLASTFFWSYLLHIHSLRSSRKELKGFFFYWDSIVLFVAPSILKDSFSTLECVLLIKVLNVLLVIWHGMLFIAQYLLSLVMEKLSSEYRVASPYYCITFTHFDIDMEKNFQNLFCFQSS